MRFQGKLNINNPYIGDISELLNCVESTPRFQSEIGTGLLRQPPEMLGGNELIYYLILKIKNRSQSWRWRQKKRWQIE